MECLRRLWHQYRKDAGGANSLRNSDRPSVAINGRLIQKNRQTGRYNQREPQPQGGKAARRNQPWKNRGFLPRQVTAPRLTAKYESFILLHNLEKQRETRFDRDVTGP